VAVWAAVEARPSMRLAAIDIGSNSIHMIVAQVEPDGRFRVLDRAKEMVRLGRNTLSKGHLSEEAIETGVATLRAFQTLAERQDATRIKAVATAAVREASNGGDFIRRVQDEVGLRVRVIHGREEARLIYVGVRHAIDLSGKPSLIVDIGGGSVELILVDDGEPVVFESAKLGVARLSERFLTDDPPSARELDDLRAHIADELAPTFERFGDHRVRRIIGTSGTLLNIASITGHLRGDPHDNHLNNFVVEAEEVAKVCRLLMKSSKQERLRIKGLDDKRADLIVAGACLTEYLFDKLKAKQLIGCTWALREGVLLDFISKHRKGIEENEAFATPRRRSVARLARHLGEVSEHGPQVARLALRLFDQLEAELHLQPEAREWLEFAALLHDVGHHIDHQNHHRHSHYLITNGELLGFQRDELEIIGQTARYHRKSGPKGSDAEFRSLGREHRQMVRILSAILRVADALDRSHFSVVRDVAAVRRSGRLVLQIDTGGQDAALEVWEARQRVGVLEEVLGLDVEFRVVS
jgi:exopolyphosphatase/guanosine-5'-triphosphate,3'-diphosphate pyrophosphatase